MKQLSIIACKSDEILLIILKDMKHRKKNLKS